MYLHYAAIFKISPVSQGNPLAALSVILHDRKLLAPNLPIFSDT